MVTRMSQPASLSRRRLAAAALLAGLPGIEARAAAPSLTPLRLVIPFSAGGPNQAMISVVAEAMAKALGRPVLIENRPSSRGSVGGTAYVATAAPDGGTLLVTQQSHVLNPLLFPGLAFDPIESFAPVALLVEAPIVVLVPAAGGPRSMAELAGRLRRATGEQRYGSGGPGTGTHIATLLLLEALGGDATHVHFAGLGPAREALAAGRLMFLLDLAPSVLAEAASGRLRPLAVLSGQRLAALPEVPTMAETGLGEAKPLLGAIWNALLAPAGTPPATVAALNAAAGRAVADGGVQTRLAAMGARATGDFRPEAVRLFLKAEKERLQPLALRALADG